MLVCLYGVMCWLFFVLCGVAVVCMWWGMFNSFVYKYSAGFPIVSTRFVCVNLLSVTLFRACALSSAVHSSQMLLSHCSVWVNIAWCMCVWRRFSAALGGWPVSKYNACFDPRAGHAHVPGLGHLIVFVMRLVGLEPPFRIVTERCG